MGRADRNSDEFAFARLVFLALDINADATVKNVVNLLEIMFMKAFNRSAIGWRADARHPAPVAVGIVINQPLNGSVARRLELRKVDFSYGFHNVTYARSGVDFRGALSSCQPALGHRRQCNDAAMWPKFR